MLIKTKQQAGSRQKKHHQTGFFLFYPPRNIAGRHKNGFAYDPVKIIAAAGCKENKAVNKNINVQFQQQGGLKDHGHCTKSNKERMGQDKMQPLH
jgi:hypothetical protein